MSTFLKTTIDAQSLRARLQDPTLAIVDARFNLFDIGEVRAAYSSAHIPGAVNRFHGEDLDGDGHFLPALDLAGGFNDLLAGTPIEQAVFYCGSGVSACHGLLAARHAGLGDGRLYAGSWNSDSGTAAGRRENRRDRSPPASAPGRAVPRALRELASSRSNQRCGESIFGREPESAQKLPDT